jgi:hypothetical protein|tara:strand:+ start:3242 stop:4111 length:870 start_codon:yes stop_codon:yes gene_type:complete
MSKGIIIFAQNNDYVDYVKIACASAGYARRNLSGFDELCLITDTESLEANKSLVYKSFERVILVDKPDFITTRLYRDTVDDTQYAPFINSSRSDVYNLSPYDETLVIDCDYFIMSNVLDGVWGSLNDFMITKNYNNIAEFGSENPAKISVMSIDMYWATVVYFKKTVFTKHLFFMISHIKNNYAYYYNLYYIKGSLFRNDYAFSIALHIMHHGVSYSIPKLPIKHLMNSFDAVDIFRVDSPTNIVMLTESLNRSTSPLLVRFKNSDLHIMNKRAIIRNIDKFCEFGEFL